MKLATRSFSLIVSLLAVLATPLLAQTTRAPEPTRDPERWRQNFLFSMQDAYLLEPGHARVSIAGGYWQNLQRREYQAGTPKKLDRDQYRASVGLELGLLPGLQADVTLPWGYAKQYDATTQVTFEKGDIADIHGGLMLQLGHQDPASWIPSVAARLGAIAQASDWERGVDKGAWAWEAGLIASKAFDDFFWHANVTFRDLANAREFGQTGKADELTWIAGFALVYSPKQHYELSCEMVYEHEREHTKVETEQRDSFTVTPGMNVDLGPSTKLGVGVPLGTGLDSYDWGLQALLQLVF